MRTKTLLCMAALAAGVATSMAQNVYSLNIVGYANVPNPIGYTFQTAPFQVTTAVTNGANEILPANTGQYDGDQVYKWTGHSWAPTYLDSTQPTGFSDSGGSMIPAPILNMGEGYLYVNNQAGSNNLTYVGQVRTGTNVVSIPSTGTREYSALGSPTPFAGGVSTALQFTNPGGALDGNAILQLVTQGGNPHGFNPSFFDSTQPSGFSDAGGAQVPEPLIPVGGGFLFDNQVGPAVTWTQIFNP
jgi:hypothetical protein